ncbi:CbtB domain-containing protein [Jannaschia rubra]|uniref:CbtB domain-containing protein n=1 Tax=Jannaschia rubra TaxID=282197 RepID=UPI0024914173|nr:CbtB-domain containing protein [Jannaschia rubra]
MTTRTQTAPMQAAGHAVPKSRDLAGLAFAAILGLGLIFVAGFSHSQTIHDVAHDQRHSMAFPCH